MKLIHRYLLPLVFTMLILMAGACSHEETVAINIKGDECQLSVLISPIGLQQTTRAAAPTQEQIKTVRIIIVSVENGVQTVEHNSLFNPSDVSDIVAIFKVKKTGKILYAIANEESMGPDAVNTLKAINEGTEFNRSAIGNISFAFDGSKAIPAIGTSTVDISEFDNTDRVEADIDMVWAAVKFDVYVTNNRDTDVTIKSFTLSSLADEEYLYPEFTNATIFDDNKESPKLYHNTGAVAGCYFPSLTEAGNVDWSAPGNQLNWVEWLKKVSNESTSESATGSPASFACERGWILDYSCPIDASHMVQSWSLGNGQVVANDKKQVQLSDTHYYAESRNTTATADGSKQNYSFSIEIEANGEIKKFDLDLTDVWALFRNTHVVINLTLENEKINLYIYTEDWNFQLKDEIVM